MRMFSFNHFLTSIASSPELRYSKELEQFLSLNEAGFKTAKSKERPARSIPLPKNFTSRSPVLDLCYLECPTATIQLDMGQTARFNSRIVAEIVDSNKKLEHEAAEICKEITHQTALISGSYQRLSQICTQIHENYNKRAKRFMPDTMSKTKDLYKILGKAFNTWSGIWQQDSDNYFKNIRMMFNFSSFEEEGLQTVL